MELFFLEASSQVRISVSLKVQKIGPSNLFFPLSSNDEYGLVQKSPPSNMSDSPKVKRKKFHISDIKLPVGFLRLEYMGSYAFLGLMYGIGTLVLFQSIVVPVVKFLTVFLYTNLLYLGYIEPVSLELAMSKIPVD